MSLGVWVARRGGAAGYRPRPGVVGRLGVPGGLRGVGGSTPVSRRSAMPFVVSWARWTSRAARRAASPTLVCGRAASTRDMARRRACGSVVGGGRDSVGGKYDERAVAEGMAAVGCRSERYATRRDLVLPIMRRGS